ncbi:hypothetical protein mRhiFer1_008994 [Rhinolophus ferrumequinum]|uniref:Uncharacterized protein n=1 Tax=Rhinolophus ferrumequinum TaxID=59479 RepID=A0A7J7TEK3_RHIFE|nr:hypothetical protein mRhiFer1_008994 [Rhinolophus ferrumequinum]
MSAPREPAQHVATHEEHRPSSGLKQPTKGPTESTGTPTLLLQMTTSLEVHPPLLVRVSEQQTCVGLSRLPTAKLGSGPFLSAFLLRLTVTAPATLPSSQRFLLIKGPIHGQGTAGCFPTCAPSKPSLCSDGASPRSLHPTRQQPPRVNLPSPPNPAPQGLVNACCPHRPKPQIQVGTC